MTLRIHDISKSFGDHAVLRGVSHSFEPGLYALHGPNGVGKSTLLSILAGIQEPDAGTVIIDGHDLHLAPDSAKARLAFVPDDCPIYPFMSGRDFLEFVSQAKKVPISPQLESLIDRLGLRTHLETSIGEMSLGTQKKTMLAAAWIGSPAVILMDEPSNALDHKTRDVLIAELRELKKSAIVVMSTHDADFAQAVGAKIIPFDNLQATFT